MEKQVRVIFGIELVRMSGRCTCKILLEKLIIAIEQSPGAKYNVRRQRLMNVCRSKP